MKIQQLQQNLEQAQQQEINFQAQLEVSLLQDADNKDFKKNPPSRIDIKFN